MKLFVKFALLVAGVIVLVESTGCSLCETQVLEKIISPDGKWVATALTRDCGATTSEIMAVNVQDMNRKHLDADNEVFLTKYVQRIHVSWQAKDVLTIDCESCIPDQIHKRLETLGQIKIVYR